MSDKTKFKLAKSLKDLMRSQPLEKITVKDIVEHCAVSRQSFYRLFQDKYDLVNWYFEVLAQQSFKQMGKQCTLREGLIKKFQFIEQEAVFFDQAFSLQDANSLINYDYACIYDFYKQLIEDEQDMPLDEGLSFLLRMYCHGSIAMTVEWVKAGRKQPISSIVDDLITGLPQPLRHALQDILQEDTMESSQNVTHHTICHLPD